MPRKPEQGASEDRAEDRVGSDRRKHQAQGESLAPRKVAKQHGERAPAESKKTRWRAARDGLGPTAAYGFLLLWLFGLAGSALAKPEFAKQVRKKCIHCHTRVKGGKDYLNPTGRYFDRYRKLPQSGQTVQAKRLGQPAPDYAWNPNSDPARAPIGQTTRDIESTREVKARMARWTRSLGAKNCYYCHAEKLPGATPEQVRTSRRHYDISLQHQEMTQMINRTLGAKKVSCYTCHLGGRGPLTMP